MNILVTGGAGFIGSNFVRHAIQQGHTVINIDKLTYAGNLNNLGEYKEHERHIFYCQDICEQSALTEILVNHKPQIVMHMAAESHVDRSIDSADEFIRTNVQGTYSLLSACRAFLQEFPKQKDTFRFIHLSTDEVFGALGSEGHFNESMPYQPNSPYAASKASSDHLVRAFNKTYGISTVIINCYNNYRPRQYPEKLIPLTILNALENKPLPIYGNGKQVRDWLFVEDHVRALFSIIEAGQSGESYCIGADNEICNLELVRKICHILDKIKPQEQPYEHLIQFVTDRPGHDFRYATDATKINNHTGWVAETNFETGLLNTVHWYVEQFSSLRSNHVARQRIGIVS